MVSADTAAAARSTPDAGPRPAAPDAVLWDMDGTLVDTEIHWFAAEGDLMEEHGLPWSHQDSLNMLGFSLEDTTRYMRGRGLELSAEQIGGELYSRVLDRIRHELPLRPGALELLVETRNAGVPTALVTNSGSELAEAVIRRLTVIAQEMDLGGEELFDLVVTGDLGLPGKPDPAPYVFAARRLAALYAERGRPGLEIGRMVAVEDSMTGIRSARESGAVVVGVANLAPLVDSGAHFLPDSLEGITLAELTRWANLPRPDTHDADTHDAGGHEANGRGAGDDEERTEDSSL